MDQYGDPFEGEVVIKVNDADYAEGMTFDAEGMVTVTASSGDITANTTFYVADPENYCAASAQVIATSEGAAENTDILFDGGKNIDENGAGNYVLADAEPEGAHEH